VDQDINPAPGASELFDQRRDLLLDPHVALAEHDLRGREAAAEAPLKQRDFGIDDVRHGDASAGYKEMLCDSAAQRARAAGNDRDAASEKLHGHDLLPAARPRQARRPSRMRGRPRLIGAGGSQRYFRLEAAKSQLTRFHHASTYLARRLR